MKLTCFQYNFPFQKPFVTGSESYRIRQGVIIELRKDKITVLGEAAPLPGFSDYSIDDITNQLQRYKSVIKKMFAEDPDPAKLNAFYQSHDIIPSLCFAMDSLSRNFIASKQHLPLQQYLFGDNHQSTLPLNGVIGTTDFDTAVEKAKQLVNKGYKTLKLKMGTDFDNEYKILEDIRRSYPSIILRVDANRSWTYPQAVKNLDALKNIDIEYCEEPLADISEKSLHNLFKETSIPLALDETVNTGNDITAYLPYISTVVLKPMILGSFSKIFATKRLANDHDCRTIITTSLESGIGRMITAILASGLGSSQSAHGLATGALLKNDVWKDEPFIKKGHFILPGRGVAADNSYPDLKNLATTSFEL